MIKKFSLTNKIARASECILGFIYYSFQMITQEKHLIIQQVDGVICVLATKAFCIQYMKVMFGGLSYVA